MLSDGAVSAQHIWKRFRADRRQSLLRDEVERARRRWRRDDDSGWRWVLRDVDFVVEPGEAVALLGANGSGKSTLLKILTGVMYPHTGRVGVGGRIGALIEVRAGIHPDLTGRENVYLYGALMGRSRVDVARRFDEIVAFSELEGAIDRPVKFYSSGMEMRLGFSVAASLEPDVLMVDEVLAVGDAMFQQKCLDRIRAVLAQGRTLVFVSHDLAAVEATCGRGVWLRDGSAAADGPIRDTLGSYRRYVESRMEVAGHGDIGAGEVRLDQIDLAGPSDEGGGARTDEHFEITMAFEAGQPRLAMVHVGVSEGPATPIFALAQKADVGAGRTVARCTIPRLALPRGRYYVWVGLTDHAGGDLLAWHPAARFDVVGPDLDPTPCAVVRLAPVHVPAEWVL
ncbi:MAG: ABC transporter ATP-binding protein, partial [Actinomycetota bacterium]|nr:ABC transporter ATP-binding protein [Actinomycetota bacterium]